MKLHALILAITLSAAATGVAAAQTSGEPTAPKSAEGETAGKSLAEKYPFLDPDWSSRRFFPPEYCGFVQRIDRSESIYWDIRRFCERRRRNQ